jgi:hypothetical protein
MVVLMISLAYKMTQVRKGKLYEVLKRTSAT